MKEQTVNMQHQNTTHNDHRPLNIGLLGLGTVGSGVVNVLQRNAHLIETHAQRKINILRAFVQNPQKNRPTLSSKITLAATADEIIADPSIDLIIEVMGGIEPALTYITRAMLAKKSVITANKALLAQHGIQLAQLAQEHGVGLFFEAAVAGGIPIIKTIREGLSANRLQRLIGIINGTANYILSAMTRQGKSFVAALKEAQQLGFAEADPHFDVSGLDAAHKLTLLATLAFNIAIPLEKVFVEGITHISAEDIQQAHAFGFIIKQLGIAYQTPEGIECRVHPTLIPADHLLAHVDNVTNAILLNGDAVGPMLLQGAGAGSEPTASAVIADLIDYAKLTAQEAHPAYFSEQRGGLNISVGNVIPRFKTIHQIQCAWYLRLIVNDASGVLADITRLLANEFISIESVAQKSLPQEHTQIVIITAKTRAISMEKVLQQMACLPNLNEPAVALRIEYL